MRDRWLFKAKFDDSDRWKFGSLYEQNGDYYIMPKGTGSVIVDGYFASISCVIKVKEETICQCTGLKDKNGKLIWENDIMVAYLDDRFPEDATYTRVVWNNNGFCTKEQRSEDILPLDKFDQEYFEVCGNLFDNPELLEK